MMVHLDYSTMTPEEKEFVDNLIRASIFDIVKPEEIDRYIEEGIFDTDDDVNIVYNDGSTFLPHRCNDGFLVKQADG